MVAVAGCAREADADADADASTTDVTRNHRVYLAIAARTQKRTSGSVRRGGRRGRGELQVALHLHAPLAQTRSPVQLMHVHFVLITVRAYVTVAGNIRRIGDCGKEATIG